MTQKTVLADVSGTVWKIAVAVGDRVDAEQELMILESMKMEIPALAPGAGVVHSLLVAEGETVSEGQALAVLQAG
jgi:acetyl-CoA carboxylase biotin carboxyl carrier protein